MSSSKLRKALFLDRDGVINIEKDYCHKIAEFEFIEDVFAVLSAFQSAGYALVIITNQAGIGRGKYTVEDFNVLNTWMLKRFADDNIFIDGVYFCPHHPTHGLGQYKIICDCRKPAPGMIFTAARELNIDIAQSLLVGDKISDIQAGRAAGVPSNYLVTTGHTILQQDIPHADGCYASLTELKQQVLG